jgi:hypothetical protein
MLKLIGPTFQGPHEGKRDNFRNWVDPPLLTPSITLEKNASNVEQSNAPLG